MAITSVKRRMRMLRTLSIAAAFLLSLCATSKAQTIVADCEAVDYLRSELSDLKSNSTEQRVTAARKFVENWKVGLPTLMKEIEKLPSGPVDSWSTSDRDYATALTETAKTILNTTDQAISKFRRCDNDRITKSLAWAARSDQTSLRINSANILGNIADNTTVCFVLHHLRDPSIDVRGRANLLGVAVAVADYAYKDNVDQINETLTILKPRILGDNLGQTQKLVAELEDRAKRSTNGIFRIPESLPSSCKGYSYTETPPK
jgi:hypothetical protein